MIRYTLTCPHDHAFEGWFRNAADFDDQAEAGHLACPVCGDSAVGKALMAPAVATARAKTAREAAPADTAAPAQPAAGPAPAGRMMALPDPRHAPVIEMMRKLRRLVTETADNVGADFVDEARRIHYGEAERRGIYGEATPEEARDLVEEGIALLPLPVLPEDKN